MSGPQHSHFQAFPYRGRLLLAMGGENPYQNDAFIIYQSVSHALRITETSEAEFWNILEHSTETV